MMPAGDLRDVRLSSKRAQIIIVTKCKSNINDEERHEIATELKILPDQHLFFSEILYSVPYHIFNKSQYFKIQITMGSHHQSSVTADFSIARPQP